MKRLVLLTGSETRHDFFRLAMAAHPGIEVAAAYCEGREKSLQAFVVEDAAGAALQNAHIEARARSEEDFFAAFIRMTRDLSHPRFIPKGEINAPAHADAITALEPDLLACYGCSLVKEPLLERFQGRILNVHLGLSPYYRGAGTNFQALCNEEPECVGATFMYLDPGIDTGEIIHQIRARVFLGDTPHQIGNRLIADMVPVYIEIIHRLDALEPMARPQPPAEDKLYRRKDFTPDSVDRLHRVFADGLVERYLAEREARVAVTPIVVNPGVGEGP